VGCTTMSLPAVPKPLRAPPWGPQPDGQGPHPALQDYKSRARMLCTGLRHRDGIAAELLTGRRLAKEVSSIA